MEVLSYQPLSGKYSPFPHDELLLTSKFRTPTFRQSSIPNQNKPADSVLQFRETDNIDGDKSSDDELPSLQKLLSSITHLPQTPPRSHSLNLTVQTAGGPAPTPPGATSAPRKSLFKNIPAWSPFNSSKYASREMNEPAAWPPVIPSRCASRGSSEREPIDGSADGGHYIGRESSQKTPIVIDDDDDSDPTDRSNHILYQTPVDNPGVESENIDGNTDNAAQTSEFVADFNLDAVILQGDDRSAIVTPTSFSPEISESDNGATLDEETQLHPSVQGDSIASLSGKRSRSPSESGRADGRDSDWVFDVFAENDGGTEGNGSPALKRARISSRPSEVAENRPPPAAAVKGVQMPGTAHADRSTRGDQEYKVHRVVGESGSEYEVTAFTKMWLPKASVDPKLVRKYRAEQRVASRVPTRRSSRLQKKD